MRVRQKLLPLFNLYPGEGRAVSLFFFHSFLAGVATALTQIAGYTLFLIEFDARLLPYTYMAVTVGAVLLTLVNLALQNRLSFATLMVGHVVVIVLVLLVFRLALALPGARWVAVALPIWYRLMYALINLEFWGLAGRVFNVRQGKRLFGLIGSGEVLAFGIGGIVTPLLVRLLGTANLLFIAAGMMIATLAVLLYTIRILPQQSDSPTEGGTSRPPAIPGGWWSSRYSVLVFLLSGLIVVDYLFVDNIFYDRAKAQYPDEAQLASVLGIYSAVLGFATLIGMVFVTGRLLSRYGLLAGLLAQPLAVAAGAMLTLVSEGLSGSALLIFGSVALTKVIDVGANDAVSRPTSGLLYQPLPAGLRLRTQTAANGIVPAIAAALAAGALLLFNTVLGFSAVQLFYVVLCLLVVWVVVAVLLNREYPVMLMQALTKRRLDGTEFSLQDASSVAVLQQALASPHPEVVIYALHALDAVEHDSVDRYLPSLLAHPRSDVRLEALRWIEQHAVPGLVDAVARRVAVEPEGRVRGAAIRTLAALGEGDALERLSPHLEDPDPYVRLGAMVGLLRSGGIEGVLLAGERLLALAQAPEPADRALAARVLGEVGITGFYRPLVPLLEDTDPQVRMAALEAAGKLKNRQLWPQVVASLAVPEVRGAAAAALVAGGESVVPELRAACAGEHRSRALLMRVARICGRIGGPAAIELLLEQLAARDADVRRQVLGALSRCGYRAEGEAAGRIRVQLTAEVAEAAALTAALVDVGDGPELALLQAALRYRFQLARDRLLLLLSFVYEPRAILRVRESLADTSGEQRAYALEVLDLLVAQELKGIVLAVCDELAPAERLRRLGAAFPQPALGRDERLRALATDPETRWHPWIRACALYAMARGPRAPRYQDVVPALAAPEPLVRETAAWALRRLDPAASTDLVTPELRREGGVDGGMPWRPGMAGEAAMLSTIERVLILKRVGIFARTPDEILADVASTLEEVAIPGGHTIIEQGDVGTSMYIIVSGRVRVHDGAHTLNELGERDVFGEMAVLDAAPRVASVTAIEETRLFRLEQGPLYDLMADRGEVARGIIAVLLGHLRARVRDVTQLQARLAELAAGQSQGG